MPSDRSIHRIAQDLAKEAAGRMNVYFLSERLNKEYVVACKNRRPYLDDRKIVFYGAVVDAVNSLWNLALLPHPPSPADLDSSQP